MELIRIILPPLSVFCCALFSKYILFILDNLSCSGMEFVGVAQVSNRHFPKCVALTIAWL